MPISLGLQQIHPQPGRSNSPIAKATSCNDFDAILAAVRRGETPTQEEMYAWEQRKGFSRLEDGPDEVEKAGMIRGFRMEFPNNFPVDLRQKLEAMNKDPRVDRWAFFNAYSSTFHPLLSGAPWNSNWKERLYDTYRINTEFTDTIESSMIRKNAQDVDNILRLLLK